MIFLGVAILCGFLTALSDIISKLFMERDKKDSVSALIVRWLFTLPFLIPFMMKKNEVQKIDLQITSLYFFGSFLEVLSAYLYLKSLEIGEASYTLQFQAITPALIPIFSPLLIGEKYSLLGITGIIIISVGSFALTRSENQKNLKSALLMITSATIYSITSVIGRYISTKIDPLFFGSTYMYLSAFTMLILIYKIYGKEKIKESIKISKITVLLGITTAMAVITHFLAISKIEAGYMIALKRTSVVFSVILARPILGERRFFTRLSFSIIIAIGVFLIGMSINSSFQK